MKDLYKENFNYLKKEIEEDPRQRNLSCSWTGKTWCGETTNPPKAASSEINSYRERIQRWAPWDGYERQIL